MKTFIQKGAYIIVALFVFSLTGFTVAKTDQTITSALQQKENQADNFTKWKRFHSVTGKCMVSLPGQPEHVQQKLSIPEGGELQYDVYVSPHEKKAVYMVLIAQYPSSVDGEEAESSLETFLNGILMQNPNNRLVFADLVDVQGFKAMDFFIQTNQVFFKGRAILADKNLYLLAMECPTKEYKENDFKFFINSFEIMK